jgi:aspartyl-tRNA(Asn)/glutamyl-tRNA(Gln) amidotransferase subunit C
MLPGRRPEWPGWIVQAVYIDRLMAKANVETVEHVARLAHLSLTEEEKSLFARQLDQILEYAESIQALDTTDVPPMSHAYAGGGFRSDTPHDGLARDRVLDDAPDPAEGLYRIPKVIG